MKFIHCADLHLNSKIDNLTAVKSRIRRNEILRTFERLCDYATEQKVTAVILAGDIFDSPKVSIKVRERFFTAIEKNSNVDFLYLLGNHDADCSVRSTQNIPSNLKFFENDWTYFRYEDTVVAGVCFDKRNGNFIYETLKLNEEDKNIVVLHGQGKNYNSIDETESVNFPRLKNKNIDYLALGHIHTFENDKIDERGVYFYVGCLDGRGFDELGKKGFMMVDTSDKKVSYEFIPFCSREYHVYEAEMGGKDNFTQARNELVDKLKSTLPNTSLIKVVLKGEINPEFQIDKDTLVSMLEEHFFYAKVYDKTTLKINVKDYVFDKSIRGEFVRCVLSSDLDDETAKKILITGLNALKGEEI